MAKKVDVTFKNPVSELYIDHLELWRKTGIGGTFAQVGTDFPFVTGTSDYTYEDLTASADSETYYYEARAYNDNGGQVEGTDYNKIEANVTISAAGGVEPLPTGSIIALDVVSGNPLHQDLSGNGYHQVASTDSVNHTVPANPVSGMVTYDKSLLNLTTQAALRTIASSSTPFTHVINIHPLDLTTYNAYASFFGNSSSGNSIFHDGTNLAIRVGDTFKDTTQTPTFLTQDADNIITVKRDASGICTIQKNDETPITLFAGADTSGVGRNFYCMGGNSGFDDRCVDAKFGRMWATNLDLTELTTPKLSEVKNWVSQKGF